MKRLGIDIGGTFTDLVSYDEATGELIRRKVLTTTDHPEKSFLQALGEAGVDPADVGLLMHGTTLVTNLLIQRRGARVGLLATEGFRDLLDIQFSTRPNPFNFVFWDKTVALVPRERRLECSGRVAADGSVVAPLDEAAVESAAERFRAQGVEAIAICFLHSFANPAHELRAREILENRLPGVPVSVSHEVDPTIREYERTSTTVTNSYALKAIKGYVDALESTLPVPVNYMHSGGGILPAESVRQFPVLLSMSGPAAGVLAGVFLNKLEGEPDLITFDMGGTSTDVSLIRDGNPDMRDSIDVDWNIPARAMSVDVNSVGAGGGSIAHVDRGGVLAVGPRSSGSSPGPACYGFGGTEPTVTDANLHLGLIDAGLLGGSLGLDGEAANAALGKLGDQLDLDLDRVSKAIFRVVNTNMALAIRQITVEKGIDPRHYKLVSFGGAGGQHAVAVAAELGIDSVLFAPSASVFSAFGLLTADLTMSRAKTLYGPLAEISLEQISTMVEELAGTCSSHLQSDLPGLGAETVSGLVDVRYIGQSHHVSVPFNARQDTREELGARFEDLHETLFGTRLGDPLELVNVRAVVRRETPALQLREMSEGEGEPEVIGHRHLVLEDREVPIVARESLRSSHRLQGPLIISEVDSSHYVPSGWTVTVGTSGSLIATRG